MWCTREIYAIEALILILGLVSAEGSRSSKCPQTPYSALKTLNNKLLCNYDREDIPVNQTTQKVEVTYILYIDFFEFDEYTNSLLVFGAVIMKWKDPRLTWNKDDYGGLKELVVLNKDVWIPDIDIDTYADMGQPRSYLPNHQCELSDSGSVGCEIPVGFMAHCNPDVRRWPFDSHNCSVSLASKMGQVRFNQSKITVMTSISDKYWSMHKFEQWYQSPDESSLIKWPKIVFSYIFVRHSGFLIATFFIPSIVMLMATLSTFCLDPEGAARIFVIGANITCHCLFLMYLAWYLPANGDKTPVIAIFFRDSFILVWVSLVITICAGKMRKAARAPPAWVTSIADSVQDSPAQYLLFNGLYTKSDAEDEGESDTVAAVMASSASNKWRRIATLLDRISLIVFATIVTALSCAFLP